jgi:hypothetical protein
MLLNRLLGDAGKRTPHHVLFHRALLALIPAASFTLLAYQYGFPWYFVVPALVCWGVGIGYLKRGSDRWNEGRP